MAYIYKTYSSGGTNNQKKFTASVWVKRCATGVQHEIASAYKASNGFQTDLLKFNSDDTLRFYSHSDSAQGATSFITNAKFRDTNAWYHIVLNVDTTQSTQSERFKMWVNGEQITSWSTSTYPAQNNSFIWGMPTDAVHQIGALNGSNTFNGLMSHFHYVQNANYAPTVFGETDSTTGEWKIKTEPTGITYSDQSFWFFKNDNLATDRSGNGNNWSTNGTLTKTEDCPSNVFCTMNPLSNTVSTPSFSQGNNTVTPNAGAYQNAFSTLGMYGSGKYYWEIKVNGTPNSANYLGIAGLPEVDYLQNNANVVGTTDKAFSIAMSAGDKRSNGSNSSYGSGFANGDIMMGALDLDNGKVWWGKNGTWFNSGNPASGSNEAFGVNTSYTYLLASGVYSGGFSSLNHNFGNGYFGTTAVSSAGTNASGNGIFEYDVPTGYTALSTKGLNL